MVEGRAPEKGAATEARPCRGYARATDCERAKWTVAVLQELGRALRGALTGPVAVEPGSAGRAISGHGHRRDSHTAALAEEADGMLVGRHWVQPILEVADRGIDVSSDLSCTRQVRQG